MIDIGNYKDLPLTIPTVPACIDEAIDLADCRKILETCSKSPLQLYEPEKYGRFRGAYIPYQDDTAWIYGRIYDLVLEINKEAYLYEPLDMVEHLWYYEFQEGDSMDWHTDIASGSPFSGRKMTAVMNLSTSDEYRGGQLLINNGEILATPRSLGSVIAFPGYLVNTIEPITSGTKRILVGWFGGENFH
jgi:PKHD-type hydroxylase